MLERKLRSLVPRFLWLMRSEFPGLFPVILMSYAYHGISELMSDLLVGTLFYYVCKCLRVTWKWVGFKTSGKALRLYISCKLVTLYNECKIIYGIGFVSESLMELKSGRLSACDIILWEMPLRINLKSF